MSSFGNLSLFLPRSQRWEPGQRQGQECWLTSGHILFLIIERDLDVLGSEAFHNLSFLCCLEFKET